MDTKSAAEHPAIAPLLAEGWKIKEVRSRLMVCALSDDQIAAMSDQAANDDEVLREKRQEKNAVSAALNREKKEREGAVSGLAARIRSGHDEIGRPMDVHNKADYGRRLAALSQEYDRFEEDRKATLSDMRTTLGELEESRQKLAAMISAGTGPAPVDLVDLGDFSTGLLRTIRLDTGEELKGRELTNEERQLGLFSGAKSYPPMSVGEYTLAVSGRLIDAGRSYAASHGMTEEAARAILKSMLPDDELPPEAGGEEEEEFDMQPMVIPPEEERPADRKLTPTVFSTRTYTVHLTGFEAKMAGKLAKRLGEVMGQKLPVAKNILALATEYAARGSAPEEAPVVAKHVSERDLAALQLYLNNGGAECFAIAEEDAAKNPVAVEQASLWPATRIGKEAAVGEA